MKYCKTCLYPDTKPDLWFDDNGVCSACLAFEQRKNIDWEKREWDLCKLIKSKNGKELSGYDCVVPVSGGKDSHFQILKMLELGFKPLAVNARTDDISPLGRKNLNNISELGVDLIEVAVNPIVRRRIAKYALQTVGDISWAEHVTIFTIPFNIAAEKNIPVVIYGENPQNEYGGPEGTEKQFEMPTSWLDEFGGLNGLRLRDLIDAKIATSDELKPYMYEDDLIDRNFGLNYIALFLGQYVNWDGRKNAELARDNGFEYSDFPVEGSGIRYENLDNYHTGIHDYFKYIKFGFGRATDIACNELRRKKITREEAKEFVLKYDGLYPNTYLGVPLSTILKRIDMTKEEFDITVNKFINKDLFPASQGLKNA